MRFFSRSDSNRQPVQRLTLNQFFDDHYFPHAKVSKSQWHHDWSVSGKETPWISRLGVPG
jgi:hypothetical protein